MQSTHPSDPPFGYTTHLKGVSFEAARVRTTEALKAQGFGVLTEIDVKATFKAKLDREFRKYVILGACNPRLANQALEAELAIGLLLPCNVCIWEEEDGSVVSIARPNVLFEMVRRDDLQTVANEADQRLRLALDQISSGR